MADLPEQVKAAADAQWGIVRKAIAAHPLTAAWIFYGVGLVIGMTIEYQLFLSNAH